ncbi:MAG: beta-galactosidase [Planctomycetota bacterium]
MRRVVLAAILATSCAFAQAPRVEIRDGQLFLDGVATYLYGGEVQYFRVRDAAFDEARTKAMWAETLDRMVEAGMNFVSTYVPWDYHETSDGVFDFAGAKDLPFFLDLCRQRGLKVLIKPGPYITAEWPTGFGSYGAVPAWLKESRPETLALGPSGQPWSFDLLGAPSGRQCSYLHPTFLGYVRRWFATLAPVLRTYIFEQPTIYLLQLDNETNLYWGDHYSVDYGPAALSYWRRFLALKYVTIGALNQAYGTSYGAFSQVRPPTRRPPIDSVRENPWHWDWFEAAEAYCQTYLRLLRGYWEQLGLRQPDVLFTTNDSPFNVPLRQVVMAHGLRKNTVGLHCLDTYPKMFPTSTYPFDNPFQSDFFTKLYDHYNDVSTGPMDFTMAVEVQGGYFQYPLGIEAQVTPEATAATLAKMTARGMKGCGLYVLRGGLNADGSVYSFQAGLTPDGRTTPRWDVERAFGRNLFQPFGATLMRTEEVEDAVAIAANWRYLHPQGGVRDDMQAMCAGEYAGLFGWLVNSGYNPEVIDLTSTAPARLRSYRAVVYLNPDFLADADATKLEAYVRQGGTLINLLNEGRNGMGGQPTAATRLLTDRLFTATEAGWWNWHWNGIRIGGGLAVQVGGPVNWGTWPLLSSWYETFWSLPTGAAGFLYERRGDGTNGRAIGYRVNYGLGRAYFLGTYVATEYNRTTYYERTATELSRKAWLARAMMNAAGVRPAVAVSGATRAEAVVRRVRGEDEVFLFVVNGDGVARDVTVRAASLARWGLTAGTAYEATELLTGRPLGRPTGGEIAQAGIRVTLPAYGSGVVHLR